MTSRTTRPIVAMFLLILAPALSSCDFRQPSDSICGKTLEGEVRRVVITIKETGDFKCIPQSEPPPAGYKEFPGETPKNNSDPRWLSYLARQFDVTNGPVGEPAEP